jgi:hypothetical protein
MINIWSAVSSKNNGAPDQSAGAGIVLEYVDNLKRTQHREFQFYLAKLCQILYNL